MGLQTLWGHNSWGDWELVVSQVRVRQRPAEHAAGVHRDHVRLERARQRTAEEVAQAYREYFSVPERLAALTTQQALALRLFFFDGQAGRRGEWRGEVEVQQLQFIDKLETPSELVHNLGSFANLVPLFPWKPFVLVAFVLMTGVGFCSARFVSDMNS